MAEKRLMKELKLINNNPPPLVSAGPANNHNIMHWTGTVMGPPDTPYEGGMFKMDIHFSHDYPFKHPEVKFTTKVYSAFENLCQNVRFRGLEGQIQGPICRFRVKGFV